MLMNIWRRGRRISLALCVTVLGMAVLLMPNAAWADSQADKLAGQVYTVINTVRLENRSTRSIYNINLEVPLANVDSVEWQDVLGEEFSPTPTDITIDSEGRRVGHYTVAELKTGQTLELVQRVAVRNYCVAYDVSEMASTEVPSELAEYLTATSDINCNSTVIREFAAQNAESTSNPYLKARLLFAAVNGYMTYDNSEQESHSAVSAFYRKSGNCEDYANLYAALLRAEGIPAKVVTGYLYGRDVQRDSSYLNVSGYINADKMRHSWVLFYINGVGWLPADPTFSYTGGGEDGSVVDWSRFAQITADNRLVYLGEYVSDNDRISYDYQGAAPLISYSSELALYSLISPFSDIVDHWAAQSVLGLYYHQPQLVTGLREGYFGVNESLTRAELVTLINRVLDNALPLAKAGYGGRLYSDLPYEHWAYEEIMKAESRGIISGYPDGTVQPYVYVTRAEAAVMLARAVGCMTDDVAVPYADMTNYSWAQSAVGGLYRSGLMGGVSEHSFAPARTMTRGEGAAVIYRWLRSDIYREAYLDY